MTALSRTVRAAVPSSTSSSASSSWRMAASSFSDDCPNCIRRSFARCAFSFSIMSRWAALRARAAISSAWSVATSSGRSAEALAMIFRDYREAGGQAIESWSILTADHSPESARSPSLHRARLGRSVRIGARQSIPSSSMESCAGVNRTTPSAVTGQMKRLRSSRLANRQKLCPSQYSTFRRSPRRQRTTNR